MTKEADDGVHVVLVTAKAKHALKYRLEELPHSAETHSVTLGSAGPVDIPLGSLRAMLAKQRQEEEEEHKRKKDSKMEKGKDKDCESDSKEESDDETVDRKKAKMLKKEEKSKLKDSSSASPLQELDMSQLSYD